LLPKLKGSCKPLQNELPKDVLPEAVYDSLQFGDMWLDAEMESVIRYLKGNTCLLVPSEFRRTLLKPDVD